MTFTTAATCNKPTGVASGDVLVAAVFIYENPTAGVTTPPSGWTLISAANAAVGNVYQRIYLKVAGGSEPSSYTWTINNDDVCAIGIGAWTGVDGTTPQDATATANSGTGANRAATGLTTATDGAVIAMLSSGWTSAISAQPSGMTSRIVWNTVCNVSDQTIATAGATGTKTATSAADANGWTTALVALRPAGGAAAGALLPPPPRMPFAILAR